MRDRPETVTISEFADYELNLLEVSMDVLRRRDFQPSKDGTFGPPLGLNNVEIAVLRERLRRVAPEDQFTRHELYILQCATMELGFTVREGLKDPNLVDLAKQVDSPLQRLHGKVLLLEGFDNTAVRELLAA